jgi:hypothetical protein
MSEPATEWGILELLGHRRLGGRVTEVEKFGTKMARIDIPDTSTGAAPDAVVATQFYGPSAIYGFHPCTEQVARAEAQYNQPRPIALLSPLPVERDRQSEEGDDDNRPDLGEF